MVLELSDKRNTVNKVTSETGYALCYYEVKFTCKAPRYHIVEFITVFQRGAGDSFISKYVLKIPVRMFADKLAVMLLLKLEGGKLFIIVGRDTAVRAYSEESSVSKDIRFFLCRYVYCTICIFVLLICLP